MASSQYLYAQTLMALAMYAGTFASYYIPIRYFRGRLSGTLDVNLSKCDTLNGVDYVHSERQKRTERFLSTCNCLATGVFIAMCFISLMPMINQEFRKFLIAAGYESVHYPFGELTMLLGFFMMLLLENRVLKWRTSKQPFLQLDEDPDDDQDECLQYKLLSSSPQTPVPELNCSNSSQTHIPLELNFDTNELSSSHSNHLNNTFHKESTDHLTSKLDNHHHHTHHNHAGHLHEMPSGDFGIGFLMLMFASSVHSVFEGLALGLIKDVSKATHLFIGILLHECLVSIALGINASKMQKGALFGLAFAATIPLGMCLGVILGYTPGLIGQAISALCQALAAGTFIHVTFYELLPAELNHGQSSDQEAYKIILMLIGFLLMAFLDIYCD